MPVFLEELYDETPAPFFGRASQPAGQIGQRGGTVRLHTGRDIHACHRIASLVSVAAGCHPRYRMSSRALRSGDQQS